MNRDELEAMTKAELVEHAEVSGVKLLALDSKGTMVDKILGEYAAPAKPKEEERKIKMQKDAPDIPMGALYDLQGKRVIGRKWKLKIHATQEDSSDVPIVVNGHNIIVKRGFEVIVDEAYIKVLENCVVETVVQDPDTGVRTPMSRQVYPYQATPL